MDWHPVRAWNMCAVRRLACSNLQPSGMSIQSTTLSPVSTSPGIASVKHISKQPVMLLSWQNYVLMLMIRFKLNELTKIG
jgi:hypothetical protein